MVAEHDCDTENADGNVQSGHPQEKMWLSELKLM